MKGLRYGLWLATVLLPFAWLPAKAQEILTIRSNLNFDYTMEALKASIGVHGYTVSHVQRCDRGLAKAGHATDLYRVIFLGKLDEVRRLSQQRPDLTPFLPLKIAIFAEQDQTIVSAINPLALGRLFDDETLHAQFERWERDLRSILLQVRQQGEDEFFQTEVSATRF